MRPLGTIRLLKENKYCLLNQAPSAREAVAVKFWTSLPGLSRWPPASFAVPGANWQEHLATADFQRIAAEADKLGFDSINVPEHVVLPRELARHMGGRWPDA